MTKFHPILFKPFLAQANVEGRKTETRRLSLRKPKETAKLKRINQNPNDWERAVRGSDLSTRNELFVFINNKEQSSLKIDTGIAIGDIIWQREMFAPFTVVIRTPLDYHYRGKPALLKESDMPDIKWKPAIHMPKAACRFWGQVTGLRFQRLQDISEEAALAEGIIKHGALEYSHKVNAGPDDMFISPYGAYKELWIEINGQASWDLNPWLLVIQYKSVEMPKEWGYAATINLDSLSIEPIVHTSSSTIHPLDASLECTNFYKSKNTNATKE